MNNISVGLSYIILRYIDISGIVVYYVVNVEITGQRRLLIIP